MSVADIRADGMIGGIMDDDVLPGVAMPFVGIPDRSFHMTDLVYGGGPLYGLPLEAATWWDDQVHIERTAEPGSGETELRGKVNIDIAHTFSELAVRVVSRLQGEPSQNVDQTLCLYDFQQQKMAMIATQRIHGGKDQTNTYRVNVDLAPFRDPATGAMWYEIEWDGPTAGFEVYVDQVALLTRK